MRKSLKSFFDGGKKPLGTWTDGSSATDVEVAGYSGFDFIIIDNEHGCHNNPNWLELVRAAEAADIIPIFRVPGAHGEDDIKKALDMGAGGILVPNVSNVEDARAAVRFAKFAPIGNRGACPYVRANRYGDKYGTVEYYARSNEEVTVIFLIENVDAVANYDEILDVEGFDAILFGRVDLAVSMGVPGDLYNEALLSSVKSMVSKARVKGIPCGVVGFTTEDTRYWFHSEVDFLTNGILTNFLFDNSKKALAEITAP